MSPKAHVLATIAGLALCTGYPYHCRDGALVSPAHLPSLPRPLLCWDAAGRPHLKSLNHVPGLLSLQNHGPNKLSWLSPGPSIWAQIFFYQAGLWIFISQSGLRLPASPHSLPRSQITGVSQYDWLVLKINVSQKSQVLVGCQPTAFWEEQNLLEEGNRWMSTGSRSWSGCSGPDPFRLSSICCQVSGLLHHSHVPQGESNRVKRSWNLNRSSLPTDWCYQEVRHNEGNPSNTPGPKGLLQH